MYEFVSESEEARIVIQRLRLDSFSKDFVKITTLDKTPGRESLIEILWTLDRFLEIVEDLKKG